MRQNDVAWYEGMSTDPPHQSPMKGSEGSPNVGGNTSFLSNLNKSMYTMCYSVY